jgi:hypothetical protein
MFAGLLEVVRVLNLPCREHSILISRLTDGQLPRSTRIGLRLHFLICGPCRHFARQLVFFRRAAARLSSGAIERVLSSARMPDEVRARIAARLRGGAG